MEIIYVKMNSYFKKLRFQMTKIYVVNHDFATSVIIKITILITNLSLLTKAIKKETES